MAGQAAQQTVENPVTTSRAVRLALTKAANDTVGLALTVSSVAVETMPLDEMVVALDDGLMLVELTRDGKLMGLAGFDMQLRAAILEMQTMGMLVDQEPDDRAPTGTDKTLCDPLLNALIHALPEAFCGTAFEGWMDDIVTGAMILSPRLAGLALDDGIFRILRMAVDLGVGDRSATVLMALPVNAPTIVPPVAAAPKVDWSAAFTANVETAPATLDAQLWRFKMPLGQTRDLAIGQILPLPGCTVNSVRLVSADGQVVAHAKLGQIGGMRALRIENQTAPVLTEFGGGAASVDAPALVADIYASDKTADVDAIAPFQMDTADMMPAADPDFALMDGD